MRSRISKRSKRISRRYKKIKGGTLAESGSMKKLRARKNGNMTPSALKSKRKAPNNSDNVMSEQNALEAKQISFLPRNMQKAIVNKKIKGEKARSAKSSKNQKSKNSNSKK